MELNRNFGIMEQWNHEEEKRWDVGLNGFHPIFQSSNIPLF